MAERPEGWIPIGGGTPAPANFVNISEEDKKRVEQTFNVQQTNQPGIPPESTPGRRSGWTSIAPLPIEAQPEPAPPQATAGRAPKQRPAQPDRGAVDFEEIIKHPDYKKLDEKGKYAVRKRYFDSYVVGNPQFKQLSTEERTALTEDI